MEKHKSYIDETGDALELDAQFFKEAKRGRPPLPEGMQKQRVNLMLDPDVVDALKRKENMSGHANAVLREALGLSAP